MKDHTRRAVAYIVLRLISGNPLPGIHDHAASKGFRFDGDIPPTKTKISVFDHTQKCHLKGAGGGGFYTLTHEGTGKPISLKIKDQQFDGFDYDSGKPYSGKVTGRSVSIHDAEHEKDFQYS
jgi:hypothetical protein